MSVSPVKEQILRQKDTIPTTRRNRLYNITPDSSSSVNEKTYYKVSPISRSDADAAFSSGDSGRTSNALVSLAFHDADWRWVQDKCLRYIDSPFPDVRRLSIVCLGHLARIHGSLDMDEVLPVLEGLMEDAELRGVVEDTLEDIDIFINDS